MRALRVVIEAPVCSFRMPHFVVGRQLSFDMPPPSTIYGLVASVLGHLPDPGALQFAYRFSYRAKADDLEHQHVINLQGGKLPAPHSSHKKVIEGAVQPVKRAFLFNSTLELYLNQPGWLPAFSNPAFTLVLGRSQDLATVVPQPDPDGKPALAQVVDLREDTRFYVEDTILPLPFRKRTAAGTTVLMPQWIGPAPSRQVTFAQQVIVKGRIHSAGSNAAGARGRWLDIAGEPFTAWVDPLSPEHGGEQRGLVFQGFSQSPVAVHPAA
ncbi:MAG: CRISPR-associated protein Cas5 [Polyangiaceae bacterium]|nr:CRISPR-associated protein Cas5 [Polyangiaceae bacterium]